MRRSTARTGAALLGTVALGWAGVSSAAPDGWSLAGAISQRLAGVTNPDLVPDGSSGSDQTALQSTTRLSATATKQSRTSTFTLGGSVAPLFSTYNNSQNALGLIAPAIRSGLTVQGKALTFTAGVNAYATSINFVDQIFVDDPANPGQPLVNQNTADAIVTSLGGNLGLSWVASSLDTFSLTLSGNTQNYIDGGGDLVPYVSTNLGGSWSRTLSPTLSGNLNAGFGWYADNGPLDPPFPIPTVANPRPRGVPFTEDQTVLSLNTTAGVSWTASSRLSVSGNLGLQFSDSSGTNAIARWDKTTIQGNSFENFDVGGTGSLSLRYAAPNTSLGFSLSQGLQPSAVSSSGGLQNTTSFSFSFSQNVSPLSSIGLTARAQLQSPLDTFIFGDSTSTAFQLSPSYSYKLDRNTSLQLGYSFTVSQDPGQDSAYSNTVFLTLTRNFNLLQ